MAAHKPIPIFVCGLIGSGKSTLAKHLAKTYRRTYISGSIIHKQLATEMLQLSTTKKIEDGFWETKEGKRAMKNRDENLKVDQEVDRRLLAFLRKKPNSISDSRLMPWLYKGKAIRIWLQASEHERARRVSERDTLSRAEAASSIRTRGNTDRKIYGKLYKIDFGHDLTPFDLIVNNEGFSAKQTYAIVKRFIDAKINSARP